LKRDVRFLADAGSPTQRIGAPALSGTAREGCTLVLIAYGAPATTATAATGSEYELVVDDLPMGVSKETGALAMRAIDHADTRTEMIIKCKWATNTTATGERIVAQLRQSMVVEVLPDAPP
jgi:hypothetical protein